ncbi:LCP family protein [Aquipuribacter hungaricus]|uniref:LCP family protein n=1 Tax=Aquipuribacter hungaricus TaxID=545624 RepID=A0ABV7WBH6_9MICO
MTHLQVRQTRPRRQTATFVVIVALVLVAAVVASLALAADVTVRARYDSRIERFDDPAAALSEASRPAPVPGEARTYLLLGSDSRVSAGDASQWAAGAQRTDAIMLVHLPADRSGLYVMSIPRDSWVDVPGHGRAKINAAFSWGGPALLVQTVEQLTGLRVDHVGVVDFEGFVAMTDALGGVEVTVPEATQDARASFPAGTSTMDGEQALDYVRQRYGLDDGDLDRVRRHQNWVRAVLRGALSRDTLTDPRQLDAFLLATTSAVALDSSFGVADLRDLALELRGLRSEDVDFLTVPVAGTGRSEDGQSVVLLDHPAADGLWQAVRDGTLPAWTATADADLLGSTVD